MIDTFITAFKLRITYMANSIIYLLKQIPIINKLIPSTLYASTGLKTFAYILGILYEVSTIFIGKLIYILIMVLIAAGYMESSNADSFTHIIFFLTLAGAFLNTQMFNPTKDKYYGIILMRMNAREYTLSSYFYFLVKIFIGFLPFTLIMGLLSGVSVLKCLLIPLFVVSVKMIFSTLLLKKFEKSGKATSENLPTPLVWGCVIVCLAAAYVPPYFGYTINGYIFYTASALFLIAAVYAFFYIVGFQNYRKVYKDLFMDNPIVLNAKDLKKEVTKNNYLKKIDVKADESSDKEGYQYFNEIFVKRHRKLLTKSAKKMTALSMVILISAIIISLIDETIKTGINGLLLTFLPYFLFVMYIINRGKVITQAMFMNCDHSMLTYRFYRQPEVIICLFRERLKSLVVINLMPAFVIAAGLPLLLYITGGTEEPLNYFLLFVSIIAMSMFFSVHNLVLYYLLQPYNINVEMKSGLYVIADSITYIVCYLAIGQQMSTLVFGSVVTVFCVIYMMLALILVYRYAPKTFKLRQ